MTTSSLDEWIAELDTSLDGEVIAPGAAEWDEARSAWNLAVDQHPAAVAFPSSADDIARAVSLAASRGVRVAVQGTGHGAGAFGDLSDSLLLRPTAMRGVSIDADARIARAECGAIWGDVVGPASEHGLVALHGSAHDTGVVGYTLGGGIGWLTREHGLASNAVTAIELVDANGDRVRVDAENDPDLFWALRGGGANYGIVTAIEFRLFPLAEVFCGWLIWPWERSTDVLEAWSAWTRDLPDQVTSVGRLLQLPDLPMLPDALRGRQLVVVEAAITLEAAEADRLLEPLRALDPEMDTFASSPPTALAQLHMDPPEPVPGISGHVMLDSFTPDAVAALVENGGPGSGSTLLSLEVRHLGGALGRTPEGAGALARLDAEYAVFGVGLPMTPDMATAITDQVARLEVALAPFSSGRTYLNFAEGLGDAATAFDTPTWERLRQIRSDRDPDGVLHAGHTIPSRS